MLETIIKIGADYPSFALPMRQPRFRPDSLSIAYRPSVLAMLFDRLGHEAGMDLELTKRRIRPLPSFVNFKLDGNN
jgi:hypothetical protein